MLHVSTFRAWFLGITSCVAITFIQSVFFLRQNPFFIPSNIAVLLAFPAGKMMVRTLPVETMIKAPDTKWRFSLNPGPFNMKGHVLISLLASAGGNHPFAMVIVTEMKVSFHRYFHPLLDLLIIQTTQVKDAWKGRDQTTDIHSRMMKKYKPIPQYRFYTILVTMVPLAIFTCEGFGKQLHFLRKLSDERDGWRRREHEKIRAIIDNIKDDLNRCCRWLKWKYSRGNQ